jgi:phage terminase large subunit
MGEGMRALCFREVQKSLKQSSKFLIESKLQKFGLGERDGWKVYTDVIKTPGDGIIDFAGLQDHTAESVKSYEGFHRALGEEAQSISAYSLSLLRPTIRWEDKGRGLYSQIWFPWNPRRKSDAVDLLLRGEGKPDNAIVVQSNWRDNPWFPSVLEDERQEDLHKRPDQYGHIWEGEYATAFSGAYFAKELAKAKTEGRVGRVASDPLLEKRAYWDIGGTGAKADARAIWIVQFCGKEIRVLDYRETSGQPLSADINWLREEGYGKIHCVLPHDGSTNDRVYDVSYESALRQAEFPVTVIPNQGKGAAAARIEAVRRILPACWFNAETTEAGREALSFYHEKKDENRNIGLGPEHDWSSHGADAFGLMAVAYEQHSPTAGRDPEFKRRAVV